MNLRKKKRVRYQYNESDESESDEDYKDSESDEDYKEKPKMGNLSKKAHNNLIETKIEILKTEPKIVKILTEPLLTHDRAKLLQLYEIYKSTTPSTLEWLTVRNNCNKLFEECKNNYTQHSRYTQKQHTEMKTQLTLMESHNPNMDLKYKILQLNTNTENKQSIYSRYIELTDMEMDDTERGKLRHWLDWAISIPHDSIQTFPFSKNQLTDFLRHVSNILDNELYGMEMVKEQILLFVSSKIQNPHMKKCSLGLIGAPGTGKTAISRLLASVLDFPFEQISMGGISNPDFLKGHEYTYIGAQPGEIVKCIRRMKYKNGILFLDEFDKISDNKDICSALLHITDPIQNSEFRDRFLNGITIDLSYIWFIYSMNELPSDSALRDRIYTINVPGYELTDKICIIKDYLFPKSLKNINTPSNSIIISKKVAEHIIKRKENWKLDFGVRSVEKDVNNITSKIDFLIKHQDKKGNLKGFHLSFNMSKVIKYPINLTCEMVNILCP